MTATKTIEQVRFETDEKIRLERERHKMRMAEFEADKALAETAYGLQFRNLEKEIEMHREACRAEEAALRTATVQREMFLLAREVQEVEERLGPGHRIGKDEWAVIAKAMVEKIHEIRKKGARGEDEDEGPIGLRQRPRGR